VKIMLNLSFFRPLMFFKKNEKLVFLHLFIILK
jgi:hypothetical protein